MSKKLLILASVCLAAAGTVALAVSANGPEAGQAQVRALGDAALIAEHAQPAPKPLPDAAGLKAYTRGATADDALPEGVDRFDHARLRSADTRKVAAAPGGGAAYLARTHGGQTCIVIAEAAGAYSAGCNPSKAPFAGAPLLWTSAINGGPGRQRITEVTVAGVLGRGNGVAIRDVSGREHELPLSPDGGFAYSGAGAALPATIIAFDVAGSRRTTIYTQDLTAAYN